MTRASKPAHKIHCDNCKKKVRTFVVLGYARLCWPCYSKLRKQAQRIVDRVGPGNFQV